MQVSLSMLTRSSGASRRAGPTRQQQSASRAASGSTASGRVMAAASERRSSSKAYGSSDLCRLIRRRTSLPSAIPRMRRKARFPVSILRYLSGRESAGLNRAVGSVAVGASSLLLLGGCAWRPFVSSRRPRASRSLSARCSSCWPIALTGRSLVKAASEAGRAAPHRSFSLNCPSEL